MFSGLKAWRSEKVSGESGGLSDGVRDLMGNEGLELVLGVKNVWFGIEYPNTRLPSSLVDGKLVKERSGSVLR